MIRIISLNYILKENFSVNNHMTFLTSKFLMFAKTTIKRPVFYSSLLICLIFAGCSAQPQIESATLLSYQETFIPDPSDQISSALIEQDYQLCQSFATGFSLFQKKVDDHYELVIQDIYGKTRKIENIAPDGDIFVLASKDCIIQSGTSEGIGETFFGVYLVVGNKLQLMKQYTDEEVGIVYVISERDGCVYLKTRNENWNFYIEKFDFFSKTGSWKIPTDGSLEFDRYDTEKGKVSGIYIRDLVEAGSDVEGTIAIHITKDGKIREYRKPGCLVFRPIIVDGEHHLIWTNTKAFASIARPKMNTGQSADNQLLIGEIGEVYVHNDLDSLIYSSIKDTIFTKTVGLREKYGSYPLSYEGCDLFFATIFDDSPTSFLLTKRNLCNNKTQVIGVIDLQGSTVIDEYKNYSNVNAKVKSTRLFLSTTEVFEQPIGLSLKHTMRKGEVILFVQKEKY